jgi:hypothetical protein
MTNQINNHPNHKCFRQIGSNIQTHPSNPGVKLMCRFDTKKGRQCQTSICNIGCVHRDKNGIYYGYCEKHYTQFCNMVNFDNKISYCANMIARRLIGDLSKLKNITYETLIQSILNLDYYNGNHISPGNLQLGKYMYVNGGYKLPSYQDVNTNPINIDNNTTKDNITKNNIPNDNIPMNNIPNDNNSNDHIKQHVEDQLSKYNDNIVNPPAVIYLENK